MIEETGEKGGKKEKKRTFAFEWKAIDVDKDFLSFFVTEREDERKKENGVNLIKKKTQFFKLARAERKVNGIPSAID